MSTHRPLIPNPTRKLCSCMYNHYLLCTWHDHVVSIKQKQKARHCSLSLSILNECGSTIHSHQGPYSFKILPQILRLLCTLAAMASYTSLTLEVIYRKDPSCLPILRHIHVVEWEPAPTKYCGFFPRNYFLTILPGKFHPQRQTVKVSKNLSSVSLR